jgi:hypothetical protein
VTPLGVPTSHHKNTAPSGRWDERIVHSSTGENPHMKPIVPALAAGSAALATPLAAASSNISAAINDSTDTFVPLIVTLALIGIGLTFLYGIRHGKK